MVVKQKIGIVDQTIYCALHELNKSKFLELLDKKCARNMILILSKFIFELKMSNYCSANIFYVMKAKDCEIHFSL